MGALISRAGFGDASWSNFIGAIKGYSVRSYSYPCGGLQFVSK